MVLPVNPHAAEFLAETEDLVEEQEQKTEFTKEDLAEVLAEQARLSDERLARVLQGTRPPAQPLQEEIRAPGITLDGLPDPTHDLQGFYKGLNERLGKRDQELGSQILQRTQQTVQAATSAQSLFSRAEALIHEAAPELDDDVIEFAAQKIAAQYRARGIDPMEALRSNVTAVAQEVLDYADERFAGREEEQPLERKPGGGRTQGITPAGARVPRPPARSKDESSNVVQELREIQTQLRLY